MHLRGSARRSTVASRLHRGKRRDVAKERRWTVQFIRPRDVVEMIGVSRTTLWRMVQAGTFPPPVRITERNRGFLLEAVEAWMKARAEATPVTLSMAPARRQRRAGRVAGATLFAEPAGEAAG